MSTTQAVFDSNTDSIETHLKQSKPNFARIKHICFRRLSSIRFSITVLSHCECRTKLLMSMGLCGSNKETRTWRSSIVCFPVVPC